MPYMTNEDEEWFNHKFQFKQLEWSNQHSEGSQHWKYHQSRLQTNKCLLRLSLELYEPNSEQVIRGWKWFNQLSKKIWPCRAITRRPSSPLGMVARHDLMTLSLKVACKKLPLPSWIFFSHLLAQFFDTWTYEDSCVFLCNVNPGWD